MFANFLIFLTTIILFIYLYFTWKYQHWSKRNIPFLKPSFPCGNGFTNILNVTPIGIGLQEYYHKFKSKGHKHGGVYMFAKPFYIPIDPDILKLITLTHFDHFESRSFYFNKRDYITINLFNLGGVRWRKLRTKINPAFKSGKLYKKSINFQNYLKLFQEICKAY